MAFIKSLLVDCDESGCPHKASYALHISPLVIAGRYCASHANSMLAWTQKEENESEKQEDNQTNSPSHDDAA
ncbi:hypothetical protein LCGC14_2180050 [marine sediment metagenome]|uniref:Uncharacterized protein n=1 Tax=marine sediment metagenome TaxID=412755 RepID=A0A0F9DML6_9ZZZZ